MSNAHFREMAYKALRSAMEVSEEQTDAGTRPLIPIPESINERADDAYDRRTE